MPNLDRSGASIQRKLAAQLERFLNHLDQTVSMKPILPEGSGTLLRCTRSSSAEVKGHHENRTSRSPR
jgi:hypothetical protein